MLRAVARFCAEVTMDAFDRALAVILGYEGGDAVTNDPNDLGGVTRWGISQRAHPTVDVRHLTRDLAEAIYRRDYWDRLKCSELPAPIALLVFDAGVNQGVFGAARMLQRCLGVAEDGEIGPKTLAAAHAKPMPQLIRRYAEVRLDNYIGLGSYRHYGKGWTRRLIDCALTATEWNLAP